MDDSPIQDNSMINKNNNNNNAAVVELENEVDPLDAYMLEIDEQVHKLDEKDQETERQVKQQHTKKQKVEAEVEEQDTIGASDSDDEESTTGTEALTAGGKTGNFSTVEELIA